LVIRKIKVVHVIPEWIESSGSCNYLKILIQRTCNYGIEHKIITFFQTHYDEEFDIQCLKYIGTKKWKYSSEFKKYLNQNKTEIDIIHLHGCWIYANQLVLKSGIPYIFKPSGGLQPIPLKSHFFSYKWIYFNLIEKKIACGSEFITALSPLEKSSLIELGILPNKIKVLPLIDLEENRQPHQDIRKNQVIYLGRISPIKNLKFLGLLAAEIENQGIDLFWIIAGGIESKYAQKMIKYFEKILPRKNFEFTGELDDQKKHEYLRESKILIHPSLSENFGHTIAEALSNCTPIIVGKNTPWKYLNYCHAGFHVELNISEFKKAIFEILNNFEEYQKGAEIAYKYLITLDSSFEILTEYQRIGG